MDELQAAADVLARAERVAVFAGAGLSAESGVPTFRVQDGLWENHRVEDVATPEGLRDDPLLVWRFYAERQNQLGSVTPNAGHFALARMEALFDDFLLITQNIDDLSERAGQSKMVKLHGDLMTVRCTRCASEHVLQEPVRVDQLDDVDSLPHCQNPLCDGLLRPAVVWFGEFLPEVAICASIAFLQQADALVLVGTSGMVSRGYGFSEIVREGGGSVIEINPRETFLTGAADIVIRQTSAEALPNLMQRVEHLR